MNKSVKTNIFAKKSLIYFILALILLFTSFIYVYRLNIKNRPENITSQFQESFLRAEKLLKQNLNVLAQKPEWVSHLHAASLNEEIEQGPFAYSFFRYEDDSLAYWSDYSVPIDLSEGLMKPGFLILPNGSYYCLDTIVGPHRIVGLFLIKQSYPYQNLYLENRYQKGFDVPSEVEIIPEVATYNIYNSELKLLFSLQIPENTIRTQPNDFLILIFNLLAFIALAASLFHIYIYLKKFLRNDLLFVLAYSIDIIIIRGLMFIFKFPSALYNSHFFNPESFASSNFIPSLGDFLFNALCLLAISYVLFDTFQNTSLSKKRTRIGKYFLIFSLFLHIFIFYRLLLWAAESLILDASYSLNLNLFFFLSTDSFIALFTISALLLSFFLVTYRILGLVEYYTQRSAGEYFILFATAVLVYFLVCFFFHDCVYLLFLPIIIYVVVYYYLSAGQKDKGKVGFTAAVIYLFLFSILTAGMLFSFNNVKEKEQRKLLAITLSSGEDPLSEYILKNIGEELHEDKALLQMLAASPYSIQTEDSAISYIEEKYLIDRLRKYEWMVTICTPERSLILQPQNDTVNCLGYFDDLFENFCHPGCEGNIFYYDNEAGMSNYISRQEFILNEAKDTVCVFIELYSFFVPEEGLGYPELLIDEKVRTFKGLENYSYARFKEGKLIFKYGDYPYRTNIEAYLQDTSQVFFMHNDYDHYFYRADASQHVMISKGKAGFLDVIAPLSYLLIFFTLFILLFLMIINIPAQGVQFRLNFRNRLQFYIIGLMIISFIIVGAITVSYVINLNASKNKEILREKAHSVLIELEHKLSDEPDLDPSMEDYLGSLLIKFSQVFFSDINLYDLNGRLLASSRPQIFKKELISKRMSPDAFYSLAVDKKLLFIHTETIGDQDYFSAYVPFMNSESKVVAYLNLPYFARQTEIQSEISAFLNAFLNVYVLMTAVAIFIALLISRFTTRPLQLIRDKMRGISFSGSNEKISWPRKDEIGTLISEYNRMVDELSRSAELLAKSERESAWREMAKQVAHEIKNPLTPMKLSVQYLQKAWDEKSSDWEERLNRFSKTIIEHIDTLSAIASEFSDFAKMPQKQDEKIDILDTVRKSLDLYTDTANITFTLEEISPGPHHVMADKNQLIRVFNNLISNSVQAIGKTQKGKVAISIDRKEDMHVIRVSDDGPGIPDEMVDKIFSPSFTTKTSGMGLGLALVKSIIQEAGGQIEFTSSAGEGTDFIISLPVYH
jgi:signal transduction histidine kinase